MADHHACGELVAEILGDRRVVGCVEVEHEHAEVLRCRLHHRPQVAQELDAAIGVVEDQPAGHDRFDRVQAEGQGHDNAEVAAASPQRPEQIRVRRVVCRDQLAVGRHQLHLEQVVDRESEAAFEHA